MWGYFVCLRVISQLSNTSVCFMFHYQNQTDQGDEKDGLEREGLEGEGLKLIWEHVDSQWHLQLHYWTIWEVVHFRGFFPKLGFFRGFSLYIIIIFRGNSEAVMGARSARACTYDQDPPLVSNNITVCNVTKQNVHFELISEFVSGWDIRIFRERAEEKNGSYNVHC